MSPLGPKYVNAKTVAWRVMLWFLEELMWFLVELIWLLDINIGRRHGIEDLDNRQDVFVSLKYSVYIILRYYYPYEVSMLFWSS